MSGAQSAVPSVAAAAAPAPLQKKRQHQQAVLVTGTGCSGGSHRPAHLAVVVVVHGVDNLPDLCQVGDGLALALAAARVGRRHILLLRRLVLVAAGAWEPAALCLGDSELDYDGVASAVEAQGDALLRSVHRHPLAVVCGGSSSGW